MLKEVIMPERLDPLGQNGQVNARSLERIFEGQESLLDVCPEEMEYLRFVFKFRRALAKGDPKRAEQIEFLMGQQIDMRIAESMASRLESQRKVIFEATPLSVRRLQIENPYSDPRELRAALEDLYSIP